MIHLARSLFAWRADSKNDLKYCLFLYWFGYNNILPTHSSSYYAGVKKRCNKTTHDFTKRTIFRESKYIFLLGSVCMYFKCYLWYCIANTWFQSFQIHVFKLRQSLHVVSFNHSTVSTAKRLASLFWLPRQLILYIILSMAMKLHVYGTLRTMYMYVWSKQMLILYFKNLLFLFLVDFKLRKSSLTITDTCNVLELISVRVVLCTICQTRYFVP